MWLRTDDGKTIVNVERALYVTIYNEDIVDFKSIFIVRQIEKGHKAEAIKID